MSDGASAAAARNSSVFDDTRRKLPEIARMRSAAMRYFASSKSIAALAHAMTLARRMRDVRQHRIVMRDDQRRVRPAGRVRIARQRHVEIATQRAAARAYRRSTHSAYRSRRRGERRAAAVPSAASFGKTNPMPSCRAPFRRARAQRAGGSATSARRAAAAATSRGCAADRSPAPQRGGRARSGRKCWRATAPRRGRRRSSPTCTSITSSAVLMRPRCSSCRFQRQRRSAGVRRYR